MLAETFMVLVVPIPFMEKNILTLHSIDVLIWKPYFVNKKREQLPQDIFQLLNFTVDEAVMAFRERCLQ